MKQHQTALRCFLIPVLLFVAFFCYMALFHADIAVFDSLCGRRVTIEEWNWYMEIYVPQPNEAFFFTLVDWANGAAWFVLGGVFFFTWSWAEADGFTAVPKREFTRAFLLGVGLLYVCHNLFHLRAPHDLLVFSLFPMVCAALALFYLLLRVLYLLGRRP